MNLQAASIAVNKSTTNVDEFTTVLLHTGDDDKVKRLFYATVHTLMMGN